MNVKGDILVCINDGKYISDQRKYEVLYTYPYDDRYLVTIVDDGDYINSYDIERFISMKEHRDNLIDCILNN